MRHDKNFDMEIHIPLWLAVCLWPVSVLVLLLDTIEWLCRRASLRVTLWVGTLIVEKTKPRPNIKNG